MEIQPFPMPSKYSEEIERKWYRTLAFIEVHDLRALH